MAGQESTLRVGVDSSGAEAGARRVNSALDSMGAKAKTTQSAFMQMEERMHGFSGIMGTVMGAAIGAAAGEFMHLLNETQQMDNQLRLVTNSSQDFLQVQNALFDVSIRTRGSYTGTVEMYRQMQQALLGHGYTQNQLIGVTETLNKALALTGTTGQRAKMGLLQLAEGMDIGRLQGQHLRSLISDMPGVAMALAKGLTELGNHGNVTIGTLMKLGKEGTLTANEIMQAFQKAAPWVNEQFGKTLPTIAQAFEVLHTKVLQFVTNLNQGSGIGQVFSAIILGMAQHLNTIIGLFTGLAVVISGKLMMSFAQMALAMATNPFGLILLVVGALAAAIGYLSEQTYTFGNTTATGFQVVKAAVLTMWQAFQSFWQGVKDLFGEYYGYLASFVEDTATGLMKWLGGWGVTVSSIGDLIKGFFNWSIGTFFAWVKTVGIIIGTMPAAWQVAWGTIYNVVVKAIQAIVNTVANGLGYVGDAVDFFAGTNYGEKVRGSLMIHPETLDLKVAETQIVKSGKAIGSAWKDAYRTDYIGNFGTAFKHNLDNVVAGDKAAAGSSDLLSQALGGNTHQADENKKAHDKLAKAREAFQHQLDEEYNKILEANGHASEAVDRWYKENVDKLNKLGLAHSKYADELEDIFTHKMEEARVKDVQNTEKWAQGINDIQRGVAKDIHEEWDQIASATGGAQKGVEAWYTQEKRLLVAAGLDHSVFAKQLEDIYKNRLVKARADDVKNAEAWAQGLSQAQKDVAQSVHDSFVSMKDANGGALANLNDWYEQQKKLLTAAGLDNTIFAEQLRQVYEDKLPDARNKDIASANGWSKALTEAQKRVADSSGLQSMREIAQEVQATNDAMKAGVLSGNEYSLAMRDLGQQTLETKLKMGDATWTDTFMAGVGRVLQGFRSIKSSISDIVTNELGQLEDGFANAFARAIVYSENLGDAMKQLGKQILTEVIAALIKMAIQWVINATIGQALGHASTAASVAQASVVASAWAPAAAAVSLATFGANAIPAGIGITSVNLLSAAFAHAKFANGGFVSGPGTGTSDSIHAMLSNGEFVVNAQATKDNFALLQAINAGNTPRFASGGYVSHGPVTPLSSSSTVTSISSNDRLVFAPTYHIDASGAAPGVHESLEAVLEAHQHDTLRKVDNMLVTRDRNARRPSI